jgi:hypothetical protein
MANNRSSGFTLYIAQDTSWLHAALSLRRRISMFFPAFFQGTQVWSIQPPGAQLVTARAPNTKSERGVTMPRLLLSSARNLGRYEEQRLKVKHESPRIFEAFLDADEEGNGFLAVHQPVIVGEREVHHRPDLDLAANDNRAFLDLMHS